MAAMEHGAVCLSHRIRRVRGSVRPISEWLSVPLHPRLKEETLPSATIPRYLECLETAARPQGPGRLELGLGTCSLALGKLNLTPPPCTPPFAAQQRLEGAVDGRRTSP
eukprot:CAMPEP_0114118762 /NCGR_PEP_ID=MMETSP0043_2-20121206/5754_1 /TAXON_ID=464988 /ORGANISM="Hemiselmis andersenii, Strain CCMP644" /LENGTH=108 /DNA_ID=CAMNT_0001211271 /DNA_START=42 /DNA_END=368 /DNA_ORIENTATION=-